LAPGILSKGRNEIFLLSQKKRSEVVLHKVECEGIPGSFITRSSSPVSVGDSSGN
jgi:hypothetical protein